MNGLMTSTLQKEDCTFNKLSMCNTYLILTGKLQHVAHVKAELSHSNFALPEGMSPPMPIPSQQNGYISLGAFRNLDAATAGSYSTQTKRLLNICDFDGIVKVDFGGLKKSIQRAI